MKRSQFFESLKVSSVTFVTAIPSIIIAAPAMGEPCTIDPEKDKVGTWTNVQIRTGYGRQPRAIPYDENEDVSACGHWEQNKGLAAGDWGGQGWDTYGDYPLGGPNGDFECAQNTSPGPGAWFLATCGPCRSSDSPPPPLQEAMPIMDSAVVRAKASIDLSGKCGKGRIYLCISRSAYHAPDGSGTSGSGETLIPFPGMEGKDVEAGSDKPWKSPNYFPSSSSWNAYFSSQDYSCNPDCNLASGNWTATVIWRPLESNPVTPECDANSNKPDKTKRTDGDPCEDGKKDKAKPDSQDKDTQPIGKSPVQLSSGDKLESTVDISIPVTGGSFSITRSYSSDPGLDGAGMVGTNWTLNVFRSLTVDEAHTSDESHLWLAGSTTRGRYYLAKSGTGSSATWSVGGTATWNVTQSTLSVGDSLLNGPGAPSQPYSTWLMNEPGVGTKEFLHESGNFDGVLLRETDVYGNERRYFYKRYADTSASYPRLTQIRISPAKDSVGPSSGDSESWTDRVYFNWDLDTTSPTNGKLLEVSVWRGNPATDDDVAVQRLSYQYHLGAADHLGSTGDLIQVHRQTLVDGSQLASATADAYSDEFTQYRYHTGAAAGSSPDERLNTSGAAHQLRMVIAPQQIEYFAQLYNSVQSDPKPQTQAVAAAALLELPDDGSAASLSVIDLASKIVAYYTSGTDNGRVKDQYLQTSCGCAGSSQGVRESYAYIYGPSPLARSTTVVSWHRFTGTGFESTPYLRDRHDLVYMDEIPYTLADVTEEINQSDASVIRRWVTSNQYDPSPNRRLIKTCMPSAFVSLSSYTPATTSSDPVISPSTTEGLIYFYGYNSENRLSETRIGKGDLGNSIGAYTRLVTTTYPTADSATERKYLPIETKRWVNETTGTTEPSTGFESTRYEYEFYDDTDAPLVTATVVDLETSDQNGEDGRTAKSYDLFDGSGRNVWSIAPDRARTEREFDEDTGRVVKVIRNSGNTIGLWTNVSLPSPRSDTAQSLTSEYTVDLLGRIVTAKSPSGVKTRVRRELRLLPDRPNLGYFVEINLPNVAQSGLPSGSVDGSTYAYSGPVELSWRDVSGNELRRSSYRLGEYKQGSQVSGYGSLPEYAQRTAATFTVDSASSSIGQLDGELSRRVATHFVSGLLQSSTEWADLARNISYATTYAYDSLGRVSQITDAEDGIQALEYDVLNRRTGVRVGRVGLGSPTLVSQSFYDFTGSPSSAAQGTGDGYVTLSRMFTGESSGGTRDTVTSIDFRGRATKVKPPLPPYELTSYDNLGRVTVRASFGSDPSGGIADTTDRTAYAKLSYSVRGQNYRSEIAIDPANLSSGYLARDSWFDANGRAVATWSPNGAFSKSAFDGLGRPKWTATLARPNSLPLHPTSEDLVALESTDLVLETSEYTYSSASESADMGDGQLKMVTTRRRNHDGAAGPLTSTNSVASYACMLPDAHGRPYLSVNYGANTGTHSSSASEAGIYDGSGSEPSWPDGSTEFVSGTWPARKDVIANKTSYDDRGLPTDSYSAGGRIDRTLFDALGRKVASVENYSTTFKVGTTTYSSPFALAWDVSAARWRVSNGLVPLRPDLNRTTSMVYDGIGQVRQLVAHLPPAGTSTSSGAEANVQVTAYDYGTTIGSASTPTDSLVASVSLLAQVRYPDETTGLAGTTSAFTVAYSYNALGELRSTTDQNGTRHEFARDGLGRIAADAAATLGTNIDGAVRRIGAQYTTAGKLDSVTSYDATTSGNVVNEVKFTYTPLLQVASVVQDVDSAVNALPNNTVTVSYSYSNAAAARGSTISGNVSRVSSMTYPDGSAVDYAYASGSGIAGIDDRMSRLSAINLPSFAPGAQDLARYQYVGSNWPSSVSYPFIGAALDRSLDEAGDRRLGSLSTQTAGTYPGWDQFGRARLQSWADDSLTSSGGVPTQPPIFQRRIARDAEGNPIAQVDTRPGAKWAFKDGAFAYDGLDRLKQARRGASSDTHWGDFAQTDWGYQKQSQEWTLDALGNWLMMKQETNGAASQSAAFQNVNETDERAHDFANQFGQRHVPTGTLGGGGLVYSNYQYGWDDAGNIASSMPNLNLLNVYTWTHDAWNRLVKVSQNSYSPAKIVGEYRYNGLHWRTVRRIDMSPSTPDGVIDQEHHLYYSAGWQMIEDDVYNTSDLTSLWHRSQYFWGSRYIDDCIAHRIDGAGISAADGWDSADKIYFHATDEQYSTVALLEGRTSFSWTDSSTSPATTRYSAKIIERTRYDAYGKGYNHPFGDVDGDGAKTNSGDSSSLASLVTAGTGVIGHSSYNADMDLNRDGKVDSADSTAYGSGTKAALATGLISDANGPDNAAGYCGYTFSSELRDYCVRYRWYDPTLGRWLQRDPALYKASHNLYEYFGVLSLSDPLGLSPDVPGAVVRWIGDIGRGVKRVAKGIWYGGLAACGSNTAMAPASDIADFNQMIISSAYIIAIDPTGIRNQLQQFIQQQLGNLPKCVVDKLIERYGDLILDAAYDLAGRIATVAAAKSAVIRPTRTGWGGAGTTATCIMYSQYGHVEQLQSEYENMRTNHPEAFDMISRYGLDAVLALAGSQHILNMLNEAGDGIESLVKKYCKPCPPKSPVKSGSAESTKPPGFGIEG